MADADIARWPQAALSALRAAGRARAMLCRQPVAVAALPEGAFLVSGVPSRSPNEAPFRALADAGADLSLDADGNAYDAVVPWDAMLYRLVMEGALVLSADAS